jgi:hypothetical protein
MNTTTNPTAVTKKLQDLTVEDVLSVYSGKAGHCCCGCVGKHRYNSAFLDEAGKNRGYAVASDEVDDKKVLKVLRLIKSGEHDAEFETNNVALKRGNRVHIVYQRTHVTVTK